ncbi:hypothetical protein Ahy_A02g004970 [Arachis hypogaea]|uniref:Uncharacterized protein n=1 Tax=Arachis hypogaea TaxID=3818 RepID=A0A445E595_ARAHY|nr:hypothetical protein Ahy_A02g004970 [Arachis hypogaea]
MEKMRALGFARSILSRNVLLNLYYQTQNYDKLENLPIVIGNKDSLIKLLGIWQYMIDEYPRYHHVKKIDLEFARDVEDSHLILIKQKCFESLQCLESLNLNGCQKISDTGIEAITSCCPQLKNFPSTGIFTDEAYKKICLLEHLKFLDLCGAQNLSDEGLSYISKSKNLASLNLTCLFGITGVTDKCLEELSKSCSDKITTLDVNGCIGIANQYLMFDNKEDHFP